MSDCLFCKISAGEIPSNKVYEDDLCYAFYDIAPQAPVHFLVIPKAHIASVSAVTAENSAVVAHIFEVIAKLAKELGLESYRVQAGLSGFHVHFHGRSGRYSPWPPGGFRNGGGAVFTAVSSGMAFAMPLFLCAESGRLSGGRAFNTA